MLATLFQWRSSGLKDWVWQRITAVVFLLYVGLVLGYWFVFPQATHLQWRMFLLCPYMQVLGTVAYLAFLLHAWIGLWTVITDYIKPPALQKFTIFVVIFIIIQYLVTGLFLLWGL